MALPLALAFGEQSGLGAAAGLYGAAFIDLLCVDKNTNQYVVLELKRGKTSDETIGQLLRYMGWVKENLSRDKTVRGIIIGDSYDKKFDFALSGIQDNTINEKIKFFKHPFSDENKPVLLKAN